MKSHPSTMDNFEVLKMAMYKTERYRKWRGRVLKQDEWLCQQCGYAGGDELEAHHQIRSGDIIQKQQVKTIEGLLRCKPLWDERNGITLCKMCHKKLWEQL